MTNINYCDILNMELRKEQNMIVKIEEIKELQASLHQVYQDWQEKYIFSKYPKNKVWFTVLYPSKDDPGLSEVIDKLVGFMGFFEE